MANIGLDGTNLGEDVQELHIHFLFIWKWHWKGFQSESKVIRSSNWWIALEGPVDYLSQSHLLERLEAEK